MSERAPWLQQLDRIEQRVSDLERLCSRIDLTLDSLLAAVEAEQETPDQSTSLDGVRHGGPRDDTKGL